MKRLTLFLLLLVAATGINAMEQTTKKFTIQGIAYDSVKNEAVAYATVLLMTDNEEPKLVTSSYTDEKGAFKFAAPQGDYVIKLNYVGFAPFEEKFRLTEPKDFGQIIMGEAIQIAAATVVAKLITSDVDKTTYNTAADPEAPALTALEMMRKVPMLTVDGEDNLRLKGETNYKILVNGKSSTLMSSNYKDVLRSMPAGSIKSIEVITNPPAKYDAEGIGGIINIITNRKAPEGFSGNVFGSAGTRGDWNLGAYLAGSAGKFNVSGNLYVGQYNSPEMLISAQSTQFNYPDAYYQTYNSLADYWGDYQGLSVEMSYDFDSLNLLTLSLNGTIGSTKNNTNSLSDIFNKSNQLMTEYNTISRGNNGWGGVGASLDYQRLFKRKDQSLTASYKVDYNPSNNSFDSQVDVLSGAMMGYHQRSDNKAYGMEHALQLDYFDPINDHHQIEVGGKYTLRPNVSNSFNEVFNGIEWVENPMLKNDLDYFQHIGSLYGAYQYKLKSFSAKAGARLEYTVNDGVYKQMENTKMFSRYFNVVPYLTFGLKIDDTQNLRLGYTQRLSRPGIWLLNPYVNNQEPMRQQTGNPDLQPELSHTFDLGYGIYKSVFNINASLTASLTNNSIEQVTTFDNTGMSLTKPENIGIKNSYTGSLSAGVRFLGGKLSLNLNLSGGYVTVKANNGAGLSNSGWQSNGFAQISAQPWKGGTVSLMGGYGKNPVSLQSRDQFYYFSGVNISQAFLENKLRISLNAQNPWTKYQYFTFASGDPTYETFGQQRSAQQSFRLSVMWRFGSVKGTVKKAKRTIDSSDQKGGGQAGGTQGGGIGQ